VILGCGEEIEVPVELRCVKAGRKNPYGDGGGEGLLRQEEKGVPMHLNSPNIVLPFSSGL